MKKTILFISLVFFVANLFSQQLTYVAPNSYDITALNNTSSTISITRETTPTGGTFNNDGSTFYSIGKTGDRILQFSLGTNYTISTATYDKFLNVSTEDGNPEDILFGDNGDRMYILGGSNDAIFEYELGTSYDIATATLTDNLDISSEDTLPGGILFNNTGSKLFLVGRSSDAVYEYDLSTDFDVSTATLNATNTLSISGKEKNATGMSFDDDGDRLFIVGTSGKDINLYTLSNAYDLSTASFTSNTSIITEDTSPQDVFFSATGNKLFITGNEGNDFTEYSLSSNFDVTTKTPISEAHSLTIELTIEGISFNNDGSKMYTIGSSRDFIVESTLSSNFNITTATYKHSFSVNSQDTKPGSIRFNNTGSKIFITGDTNNSVFEYGLSSDFDLTTISYSGNSYSAAGVDTSPKGLAFNNDGSKMYVAGNQNNSIYEFDLSTEYDLSDTVTLVNTLSITTEESSPTGVSFNYNGTKMFVIGNNGDEINSYVLASVFDISTANFNTNFKVNTEDTLPNDITINNDGTKFFITGATSDAIFEYLISDLGDYEENSLSNDGSITNTKTLVISLSGDTFVDLGSGTLTTGLGNQVVLGNVPIGLTPIVTLSASNSIITLTLTGSATSHQIAHNVSDITFTFNNSAFTSGDASLVTNATSYSSNVGVNFFDNNSYLIYIGPNSYNVENLEHKNTFSITAQETAPQDISFNFEGSKMYVIGTSGDDVNEYNLVTKFDISTATFNTSFSVNTQEINPNGISFNPSGTRMYIIGTKGDDINEYILSVAFDVSSASYSQNFSVSAQEINPRDVVFSTNGEKMFIVGTTNDTVYQYNLATGFDISTAVYSGISFSVLAQEGSPRAIAFSYDGNSLFILGSSGDDVNQYNLSSSFDISSPTYTKQFSFKNEDTTPTGITFNPNGTKLYIVGDASNSVYEFDVISDFTEESSTNNGNLVSGSSLEIYLINGTFDDTDADNLLSIGGAAEVNITDIPSGLTPTIALSDADTKATLTFTGSATSHAEINDVSSLNFTFTDGAFVSMLAADIKNTVGYTSSIGVNFNFCPRNIRYINGDWVGGSGSGGRPNTNDDALGVYVDDDVTLNATSDCFCLEITSGNALTLSTIRNIEVSGMVKLNGDIRLIGVAQLIQTHSSTKNLEGTGNLYIDQTSKTNDFYGLSYWTSPVVTNGSTTYTIQNILKDGSTPTSAISVPGNIDFITGTDGATGSPIKIAKRWIYGYLNGTDGTSWLLKEGVGVFNPGEGFSLKSPQASQIYTFLGTPNDGDYSFSISANSYSLLGNPYPSALDANDLFTENPAIASLYFWEHKADNSDHNQSGYIGGYSVRNAGGGTAANTDVTEAGLQSGTYTYTAPGRYIPVAQGFFIEANATGGIVTFSNSQRNYSNLGANSHFFKTKKINKTLSDDPDDKDDIEIDVDDPDDDVDPPIEIPIVKLGFEYKNKSGRLIHRQVGITFKEGNSFSYDNGYESTIFDLGDSDLYFKFPNDDSKYVITGVQEIQENIEIPIAVKIGAFETVKIMVDSIEYNTDKDFFLLDKLTNTTYNLNDSVTLNLNKETLYTDRFFITLKNKVTLSIDTKEINPQNILAYFNSNNNNLIIEKENIEVEKVEIYDLLGKKISEWNTLKFLENKIYLKTKKFAPNIYIIKIKTKFGTLSKKIILN